MLTYPEIDKVALDLGLVKIHWYGIMYLVAFAAAWLLARYRAQGSGSTWNLRDVDDLIFFGMLGTILGGRIGYVLAYGMDSWVRDLWYPLKIWEGGMSFHGGLAGVLLAFALFARMRGRRVWDVYDFAAPLPGIGLAAGRIGNFINGELWGKPTDAPWAFKVADPITGELVARHASQLYEALLEGAVLFALLWWFTSGRRPRYAPAALFLCGYAVARLAVETVRLPDDQIGYLAGDWLTMGMLLTLPVLLLGLTLAWLARSRHEPSGNYAPAP